MNWLNYDILLNIIIILSIINSLFIPTSSQTYTIEFTVDTPNEGSFKGIILDEDNGDEIELETKLTGFSPQSAVVSFDIDASSLKTLTSMYLVSTTDNEDSLKITTITIDDINVDMTDCNQGHHCKLEDTDITDTDCSILIIADIDTSSPSASVSELTDNSICIDNTLDPTDEPSMKPTSPTVSPAPTEMPVLEPTTSPITNEPTMTNEPTSDETDEPTSDPDATDGPTLEPTMEPTYEGQRLSSQNDAPDVWQDIGVVGRVSMILGAVFIIIVLIRVGYIVSLKWKDWKKDWLDGREESETAQNLY